MINAARHRSLMDAKTENSIRTNQIESFGRLMAGLAHDMKNHLGIIRESNGLMDDLLAMGAFGEDTKMVERLKKSIAAIERRVVISAKMMHSLSGIAHRPDSQYASFLINDLIAEEHTFLERFSRLKQVEVAFQFAEDLPAIYNDPSLLQHVLYRVYIACLELIMEKQTLIVLTKQEGKKTVVLFRLPKKADMSFEYAQDEIILAAIGKLEGELTIEENTAETVDIKLLLSSLSI